MQLFDGYRSSWFESVDRGVASLWLGDDIFVEVFDDFHVQACLAPEQWMDLFESLRADSPDSTLMLPSKLLMLHVQQLAV